MLARGAWRGVVVVGLAVVLGCDGDAPSGPGRGPRQDRGTAAMAQAPMFSEALRPETSGDSIGPITLGAYPEPTLVEIVAEGNLERFFGDVWIWGIRRNSKDRDIDPAGEYSGGACHSNAWIGFDAPASAWFCDAYNATANLPAWRTVRVVQGEGRTRWIRHPTSSPYCDTPTTPACYTYSGEFQVRVTPFPAEHVVKASRYVVTPGQSVTFTASVTPVAIEGVAVPHRVTEWRWVSDEGGNDSLLTQCAGQDVCSHAPTGSGTMRATGFANGAAAAAEVHIRYLCEPTGDPSLDSLPLIDGLLDAMGRSGDPDQPNQAQRLEHYLLLICEGGICRYEILPGNGPCGGIPPIRFDTIPGLVATGHTHPFNPIVYDPVTGRPRLENPGTDSLPDACPRGNPRNRAPRGSAPRPSTDDIRHVGSLNNSPPFLHVPHYVIDPRRIHAIPGGVMTDDSRKAGIQGIPRGEGPCSLQRRGCRAGECPTTPGNPAIDIKGATS